jgi:glycosyltransferase involved in cell wall biosynthesis
MPKITLINTYEKGGGAALACKRLTQALSAYPQDEQLQVRSLVGHSRQASATWQGWAGSFWQRQQLWANFIAERLLFWPHEPNRAQRFSFSPGRFGVRLHKHPWLQDTDLIHLHWINFGLLSVEGIAALGQLQKPIVWTLHDMWAFTGGCHYSGACTNYQQACGHCPSIRRPAADDLSHSVWASKKLHWEQLPLHIVTCSEWLAQAARQSSILRNVPIHSIPNPIDTDLFRPAIQPESLRQKHAIPDDAFVLLFGAANIQDPRKGFDYLIQALQIAAQEQPAMLEKMILLTFGKQTEALPLLPVPVRHLGLLDGAAAVAEVYGMADAFVLPSLEDNLPNTLMEALACGTPAAAFAVGGIPEMIQDGHNGRLATPAKAPALYQALCWLYETSQDPNQKKQLRHNARQHALQYYAQPVVARQYQRLYEGLLYPKTQPSAVLA